MVKAALDKIAETPKGGDETTDQLGDLDLEEGEEEEAQDDDDETVETAP